MLTIIFYESDTELKTESKCSTYRTVGHILWSCTNGELKNSNGKTLMFMGKEDLKDEERNNVTTPKGTDLIPTFKQEGKMKSTEVQIKSDRLRFIVAGKDYYLKPLEFPSHSFLKEEMGSSSLHIEISVPGKFCKSTKRAMGSALYSA